VADASRSSGSNSWRWTSFWMLGPARVILCSFLCASWQIPESRIPLTIEVSSFMKASSAKRSLRSEQMLRIVLLKLKLKNSIWFGDWPASPKFDAIANGISKNIPWNSMICPSPYYKSYQHLGVSENRENPFLPNGFADHYPVFKWLFHWED